MNAHRVFPILAGFLFATTVLMASEPATIEERVAADIQKLGHVRFAVRQQAASELVAFGEPALKWLQAARSASDAEVRQRADEITRLIENKLRNEALVLAPKLNLKYDGKPLDEALADVCTRSGLPYILDPKSAKNPKQMITLNTGDVPYWEAIEKFLAAARLTEVAEAPNIGQGPGAEQEIQLLNSTRIQKRDSLEGRIRLVESKASLPAVTDTAIRVKVVPYGTPGSGITRGTNEINFVLDVTPAISLSFQGSANIDVRKAIDDRGGILTQSHVRPPAAFAGGPDQYMDNLQAQVIVANGRRMLIQRQVAFGGQIFSSMDGNMLPQGNPRHVTVTLLGQETNAKFLRELRGVVAARVLTPPQALLKLENIQQATSKTKVENGAYRLEVTGRTTDPAGYVHFNFRLGVLTPTVTTIPPFVLNGGFVVQQAGDFEPEQPQIVFEDASGRTIGNASLNPTGQSVNAETQTTDYRAVLPADTARNPIRFMLKSRTVVSVEVPFELKNIPLP